MACEFWLRLLLAEMEESRIILARGQTQSAKCHRKHHQAESLDFSNLERARARLKSDTKTLLKPEARNPMNP